MGCISSAIDFSLDCTLDDFNIFPAWFVSMACLKSIKLRPSSCLQQLARPSLPSNDTTWSMLDAKTKRTLRRSWRRDVLSCAHQTAAIWNLLQPPPISRTTVLTLRSCTRMETVSVDFTPATTMPSGDTKQPAVVIRTDLIQVSTVANQASSDIANVSVVSPALPSQPVCD